MGKWNEAIVRSADILTRNKAAVTQQLPNLQAFCQTLDAAEKTDAEILALTTKITETEKELVALKKSKADKIAVFGRYAQDALGKVPTYDRALEQFENANKKLASSELTQACGALRIGLNRVEGLLKIDAKPHFK